MASLRLSMNSLGGIGGKNTDMAIGSTTKFESQATNATLMHNMITLYKYEVNLVTDIDPRGFEESAAPGLFPSWLLSLEVLCSEVIAFCFSAWASFSKADSLPSWFFPKTSLRRFANWRTPGGKFESSPGKLKKTAGGRNSINLCC